MMVSNCVLTRTKAILLRLNSLCCYFWRIRNYSGTKVNVIWALISHCSSEPRYAVFANSEDPDQEEANWSGSALFVNQYVISHQQFGLSDLTGWQKWVWHLNLFSMTKVNIFYSIWWFCKQSEAPDQTTQIRQPCPGHYCLNVSKLPFNLSLLM